MTINLDVPFLDGKGELATPTVLSQIDARAKAATAQSSAQVVPRGDQWVATYGGTPESTTTISSRNLTPSPDFAAFPNGWKYQGSGSGVVTSNSVAVTGTGAIGGVGLYSDRSMATLIPGRKMYVSVQVKADAAPSSWRVSLSNGPKHVYAGGSQTAIAGTAGTWTTISDVVTLPAEWANEANTGMALFAVAQYSGGTAASGRKVEIQRPIIFDLTEAYGAGNEPGKARMDELAAGLPTVVREVPDLETISTPPSGGVSAVLVTRDQAQALVDSAISELPTPETPATAARRMGPPVIFRFDDGFVNNLTLAAPLLAKHGYSATLYAATRPADWAGASMPMMTPAQWKELHDRYGWDIDSHVTAHQDATVGDLAVWAERLRESCDDIVQAGLPWPRTFAYPNGSRTAATDRYVARLFQVCGLTGHPSTRPVDRAARTFFTGWTTVNGLNPAPGIAQLKSYVRAATNRGEVPILGFHGITEGAPPAAHHMSLATLTEIVEWLAAEGYSSMLMGDLLPQNLLADPGFEEHALGTFPWITSGGGWSRTRSTAVGHTGWYGADLLAGGAGLLSQTAPVDPGQTYRLRVRFGAGRTITGGRVDVVAIPQTPTGGPVGPTLTVGTMTGGSTEADVTGLVTVPAGASVLKVGVQPTGFTGSGVRVVHAALYHADLYDPLA